MKLHLPIDQIEITPTSVIIDSIIHDLESMLPLRIEADPDKAIAVTLYEGDDKAARLAHEILVVADGLVMVTWIEGDIFAFNIDEVDSVFGITTETKQ